MVEYNSWEREEDLENTKEVVAEFEERLNAEVRKQRKLEIAKERDFRRRELSEKYTAKILYGWDDVKFEDKYLKKLERNLERGIILELKMIDLTSFYFSLLFLSYFNFILEDLELELA